MIDLYGWFASIKKNWALIVLAAILAGIASYLYGGHFFIFWCFSWVLVKAVRVFLWSLGLVGKYD